MSHILEKAHNEAYLPFLETFEEFEDLKLNIHISGYLLEWLIERKPSYIERLKALVKSGRVEVLTGAMYEPVLSMIPLDDAKGQIKMHRALIREIFDFDAKGMWVAERVYEPHYPMILEDSGISYIVLDDNHFRSIGYETDELFGYYLTDFEGRKLRVFPGLEYLRYAIPFKDLTEIDGYFREAERRGKKVATFADDGEKFGLWPGTFKHVYEDGWLRRFLKYLTDNKDWLRTTTFYSFVEKNEPLGLAYLDCNSYREMGEWCLPPHKAAEYVHLSRSLEENRKSLLKGGYFKYFLAKYEESNDMHKRMMELSRRLRAKEGLKRYLYMAQCNDAYWHGVFGGLYLPHLRSEIYRNIIRAEREIETRKRFPEVLIEDVNMDGQEEIVLNTRRLKAYFLLREGGIIYELDFKEKCVNLVATLRRRYEAYHERVKEASFADIANGKKTIHDLVIKKEEGLERLLKYDWYRRGCLLDHVLGTDVDFESFLNSEYYEPGDFIKEPYEAEVRRERKKVSLILRRQGNFWKGKDPIPLRIEKVITTDGEGSAFSAEYSISGDLEEKFLLGVEFNFSFLGLEGERYMEVGGEKFSLRKTGVLEGSENVIFYDPYQEIEIRLNMDKPDEIWTHPVEVVSLSEGGFERNYQSTMIMPIWEIDLKEGRSSFKIEILVNGISRNNNV